MRFRYLLAALAVSLTYSSAAEAAPKAKASDLDRVETAYTQYRHRTVERRPRHRRAVYRSWGPRRSVRAVRYAPPVRYARPYRYYYRPAPLVRHSYPYGYYGPAYGYYSPVRYYAGYGWPYYRRPWFGGPYGGISVGIGW